MKGLALVLAAGKGTRMKSSGPKVMQSLLGKPMLWYVVQTLTQVLAKDVYPVVGYAKEQILAYFKDWDLRFIEQEEQLGTGHAVQCAWPLIEEQKVDYVLVINGDTPLVQVEHVLSLIQAIRAGYDLVFLSLELADPGSYGRVVRDKDGKVLKIVEAKDCPPDLKTREINAGIYGFSIDFLSKTLFQLTNNNAQKEYYITDLVQLAIEQGYKVKAINAGTDKALLGVNTLEELVEQEEWLRKQIIKKWLKQGVLLRSGQHLVIGPEVELEPGAEVEGPAKIMGKSKLTKTAWIGSYVYIEDSFIAGKIYEFSHIVGAKVAPGANIGPYARLRPGAIVEDMARVGNFVEMKKTVLGPKSKASHLTYLGDCEVEDEVNIGAGTITCNYDGQKKHKTIIRKGAFIGSNTALVAPVEIGNNALVGAGSTITKNVEDNTVVVARAKQVVIRKKRDELGAKK